MFAKYCLQQGARLRLYGYCEGDGGASGAGMTEMGCFGTRWCFKCLAFFKGLGFCIFKRLHNVRKARFVASIFGDVLWLQLYRERPCKKLFVALLVRCFAFSRAS